MASIEVKNRSNERKVVSSGEKITRKFKKVNKYNIELSDIQIIIIIIIKEYLMAMKRKRAMK